MAATGLSLAYPFLLGATSRPLLQQSRAFGFTFITVNLVSMILIAEDQATGRFGRYNALRVLQQVCLLAGLVFLWFTSTTTPPFILLVVAMSLAAPFAARIVKYLAADAGRVRVSDVRELLRTGARIQVLNVSGYIATQLDQALLSFLLPARDFGLYVVAMAVGSAHTTIIGPSLSAVEFPRLAALTDPTEAMRQAMNAGKRAFRISLACSVVVPPVALLALPLVYGKSYSEAALPAVILSLGMGARSFRSYFSYAARAVGFLRIALITEWAAAGATVLLLPLLATWLGLTGATIGVTLANWLGLSVILLQLSRKSGVSIRKFLFQSEAPV
jgi:O-antigen/teichoic acid export membrane protein